MSTLHLTMEWHGSLLCLWALNLIESSIAWAEWNCQIRLVSVENQNSTISREIRAGESCSPVSTNRSSSCSLDLLYNSILATCSL
jgi:hypothetical protein